AGFDRARRPQGQSGVDQITNKSRVARRRGGCERGGRHKYSTPIMSEGAVYANENFAADHHIQSLPAGGLRHVDGFEEAPVAIGRAGQNQQEGGGKFTAWGSHLSGINLALKPGKKIVQAWRATGWWPDHYSIAIFDITKVRGGSKLKFTQIGIPPSRYSGHYRGWIETYWTPMKEIFATGAVSDTTRRRVKIDREQRIRTGKFRRKISGKA